ILLSIPGVMFVRRSIQPLAETLENQSRELQFAEEKYRTLMESIQDGVFVAQDFHFVYCNPALATMTGYTITELLEMPFDLLIAPEFLRLWKDRYKARIDFSRKEPPSQYEIRLIPKNSKTGIWVELHAEKIHFKGKPAVLGILRD